MNAIMIFSIMVSQPLLRLKASSIYVTLKTNPKHQITMRKSCSKNNKTLFIQFFSRPSLQTMAKHLSENMKLTGMPSPFLPSSIHNTPTLSFVEVKSWGSPSISPTFSLMTLGEGLPCSSLCISRNNFASWTLFLLLKPSF